MILALYATVSEQAPGDFVDGTTNILKGPVGFSAVYWG